MRRRISVGDSQVTLHLLAVCYVLCICNKSTVAFAVNQTVNPLFPAVFLFGDSILDAGNNNNLKTLLKCNFPPYGKDFINHTPTGRFSNGKVPGDFIASSVGVKELVPAYLSQELADEDLLTGVSFASGSTGYDPITSLVASVISMEDQLKLFGEYKEKLKAVAGKARADSIISGSLYIVCAGSNDLVNTYFPTLFRKLHYDVPSYANFLVGKASDFVQKLYIMGARKIGLVGLPPLGCLPSQITFAGEILRQCVDAQNQAALLYNSKISAEIKRLAANFEDSKFVYLDIYYIFFDIIQRPLAYGTEDRWELEMMVISNKRAAAFSLLAFVVFLHHLHGCAIGANQTARQRPPAIIVFGDSIVDPGNNNVILTTIKCNFPPYGKDFVGHKATGRFSNGKIPSDIIASQLGIKEYVPAYLGTELSAYDLITGVSFASGGCGFDPLTSQLVSVLSMDEQLDLFIEYKEKVKAIVGEKRAAYITNNSVYLVVTGTDDLANTYFTTPFRRLEYDLPSYINFTVQSASTFVQKLYHLGARKIRVVGAPPIGCLPSQRTLAGGIERICDPTYNQAALFLNSRLSKEMQKLNSTLPKSRILYIDMYTPLLDIILHPSNYGFVESKKGCCGTGTLEVTLTCNSLTTFICEDASKYVFWDSYHPTERAYEILMTKLAQRYGAFIN